MRFQLSRLTLQIYPVVGVHGWRAFVEKLINMQPMLLA
jgi:hypothetical protein